MALHEELSIVSLKELYPSDRVRFIPALIQISEDPVDEEYFLAYVRDDYKDCVFLSNDDEEVYAFACISFYEHSVDIEDIVVDENYRSKGYGRKLMDLIIENYVDCEDGPGVLSLECNTLNKRGLLFYIRYGFQIVGFVADYYGNGDSAVYMQYKGKEAKNFER